MPYVYDSHIVPTPKFLIAIQGLIILTAAAVIGLSAYALSFNGPDNGNGWASVFIPWPKILRAPKIVTGSAMTTGCVHARAMWTEYLIKTP